MRSERKKQVMTLSILLAAVLVISIGFAAFTRTFEFETNLTVNPDSRAFSVKFSKTASNPATTGTVTPTITPSTETANLSREIVASDATIDGSTTLSGLYATLISPGDSVTYSLYAVNEGKYDTYLSYVSIGNKTCIAGEGATPSLVDAACRNISITATAGADSYTTSKPTSNHKLLKGMSEVIKIELKYLPDGDRADGPFTVDIGDIVLHYSTKEDDKESYIGYTGTIYRNSTNILYVGDNINHKLSSYELTPSYINKTYYLKHDVVEDIVTASYACLTYVENGTRKDVCLRGVDSSYYASNQAILRNVESYFATLPNGSTRGYCVLSDSGMICYSDSIDLRAYSNGDVSVHDGNLYCHVTSTGASTCDL